MRSSVAGYVIAGLGLGTAIGVGLGALVIAPHTPGFGGTPESGWTMENPEASQPKAKPEKVDAPVDERVQRAQRANEEMVAMLGAAAVKDELKNRPVITLTAPGAPGVQETRELLQGTEAIDAGTIELTSKFFEQKHAEELSSVVGEAIKDSEKLDTPQKKLGALLGTALMLNPESGEPLVSVDERAQVLQGLRQAGFIMYEDDTIRPAQGVVLFAEGGGQFAADVAADTARGIKSTGNAVVIAGGNGAEQVDAVGVLRGSDAAVSTVDNVDQKAGQVAVVLSLAEQMRKKHGHYGVGESAQSVAPGQ
ncbi:copper transporter [Corynebacterium tapiri]|uniref:Copper transporter n=1 Tax=Corynebacterium tapiri TaxID=1448266 RepID=A0A5C4U5R6_9CORY|nr:copper transporter [Corynebacterium tapiri]TNL97659.1 copper transporter [Corynebacterium tapiri]